MRISDWSSDVCSSDLISVISVCPGSFFIEIPRGQVRQISLTVIFFGACYQAHFGMDFQTGKAIPDRHPFLLQFAGPVEICSLIEASQQFNQYKHFFPVLCRVNERVYNHGMLRKPVKCDPDIRHRSEEQTSELPSLMRIS